jgi:hypothetical protein
MSPDIASFTASERTVAVILLKEARLIIAYSGEKYVCTAIHRAAGKYGTDIASYRPVAEKIEAMISKRIAPRETVMAWLCAVKGINCWLHDRDSDERIVAHDEYRLRWIDSMIAEFREESRESQP